MAIAKNTIWLWYEKDAEAAARFYTETFPNSSMGAVQRAPSDYSAGKAGDVPWMAGSSPAMRSERGHVIPDRACARPG
jgi:predicted 3-demethylubiquinone-9 3-methyltransferase (glyoxalase superfamily)